MANVIPAFVYVNTPLRTFVCWTLDACVPFQEDENQHCREIVLEGGAQEFQRGLHLGGDLAYRDVHLG